MKIEKSILKLSALLFVLIFSGCDSDQFSEKMIPNVIATMDDGQKIIRALEEYKTSNGKYPEQLDSLIPTYIKAIPKTQTPDKNFSYYTGETNSYSLHFSLYSSGLIFPRAATWFEHRPNYVHENSGKVKVHFVANGWAYKTYSRHEVGEGGRVPDRQVYNWDHIVEWCRTNNIECYIPQTK